MAIGGILTAMVTPFDAAGRVDEDSFARLLRHLLAHGSDGVVVAATTGEAPTLTDEEKYRLWDLAVSEAGDALVVAGTGTYDTAHSVHLTEKATEIGVGAVLAVTPYYNRPNRRGILAHYRAICGATDLPVIAYNIPSRTATDMDNDLLSELAADAGVAAVKQARYEDAEPIDGMELLAGNDDMLCDVLEKGGSGGILVSSHLVGEEMRRMIDEPESRREIHESLKDLFAAMFVTTSPIPVKAALNMLGHEVGAPRLPLVEAEGEELDAVRGALERHGLLTAAA